MARGRGCNRWATIRPWRAAPRSACQPSAAAERPCSQSNNAATGSWLPGEYLTTEHHIELAAPLPDDAILRVGLYNPDGNVRLPASPGGDAVELTP